MKKIIIFFLVFSIFSINVFSDKKVELENLKATVELTFKEIGDALGRPGGESTIRNKLSLLRGTLRNWSSSITWDIADIRQNYPSYKFVFPQFPAELKVETYDKLAKEINEAYKTTLKDIEKAQFELGKQQYFTAMKILLAAFVTFKSSWDAATGTKLLDVIQLPSNLKSMIADAQNQAGNIERGINNIEEARNNLNRITKFKEDLVKIMHETRKVRDSVDALHHEIEIFKYTFDNISRTIDSANGASQAKIPESTSVSSIDEAKSKIQSFYSAFKAGQIPFDKYISKKRSIVSSQAPQGYKDLSLTMDPISGRYQVKFEGKNTTYASFFQSRGSTDVSHYSKLDSFLGWCGFDSSDHQKRYELLKELYTHAKGWNDVINNSVQSFFNSNAPTISFDIRQVTMSGTSDLSSYINNAKDLIEKQNATRTDRVLAVIDWTISSYKRGLFSWSYAFPHEEGYASRIKQLHYTRDSYINARANISEMSSIIKQTLKNRERVISSFSGFATALKNAQKHFDNYEKVLKNDANVPYLGSKDYYPGSTGAAGGTHYYYYRFEDMGKIFGSNYFSINIRDIVSIIRSVDLSAGEKAESDLILLKQIGANLDNSLDDLFRSLNDADENILKIKVEASNLSNKLGNSSLLKLVADLDNALGNWIKNGKPQSQVSGIESICDKIYSDPSDKSEFLTNLQNAVSIITQTPVYSDIATDIKGLANKIPMLKYFNVNSVNNINAFKVNLFYFEVKGEGISKVAQAFQDILNKMNPWLKNFDNGEKVTSFIRIKDQYNYAESLASSYTQELRGDETASGLYNTIRSEYNRVNNELKNAYNSALNGIRSAYSTVISLKNNKNKVISMHDNEYNKMIMSAVSTAKNAMGIYSDYCTSIDGEIRTLINEFNTLQKQYESWREIRKYKPVISSVSINNEFHPVSTIGRVTVYKNNLVNNRIYISGSSEQFGNIKLSKVYFSHDNNNGHVNVDKGIWEFFINAPYGTRDIFVSLYAENEINVKGEVIRFAIKYDSSDYTALIEKTMNNIATAYTQKNLTNFMRHISEDHYVGKSVVSEAVRNDFASINNIQLRIYTNSVIPSDQHVEVRTKWDMRYVDKTGSAVSRTGSTVFIFTLEQTPKILNSFGSVLFGIVKSSPFDVGSQVIFGMSNLYDYPGVAMGHKIKVLDLDNGTTIVDNHGNILDTNRFDFGASSCIFLGNNTQMLDLGKVDFDSITEVPETGYNINQGNSTSLNTANYVGNVFAIKTRGGLYAKLKITKYNEVTDPNTAFYIDVIWAVQKNGSNTF